MLEKNIAGGYALFELPNNKIHNVDGDWAKITLVRRVCPLEGAREYQRDCENQLKGHLIYNTGT